MLVFMIFYPIFSYLIPKIFYLRTQLMQKKHQFIEFYESFISSTFLFAYLIGNLSLFYWKSSKKIL